MYVCMNELKRADVYIKIFWEIKKIMYIHVCICNHINRYHKYTCKYENRKKKQRNKNMNINTYLTLHKICRHIYLYTYLTSYTNTYIYIFSETNQHN